jgi:tetratricopeptide (TPR) repeat protein
MYKIIQVIYQNKYEGVVDDVTLNELISANKITKFYRPSESRWVDINHDSIRRKASGYTGPERRQFRKNKEEQKSDSLLSRVFKRKANPLTAQDWFEQGFALLYNAGNFYEAIRVFGLAIELDPSNARAYLNRGIAYERMKNVQQAFEDYSRAIQLLPQDAKAYYLRGMLLGRDGKDSEAIADLKTSAALCYKLAIDFLTQKEIAR